jgi:hypothetical protein
MADLTDFHLWNNLLKLGIVLRLRVGVLDGKSGGSSRLFQATIFILNMHA